MSSVWLRALLAYGLKISVTMLCRCDVSIHKSEMGDFQMKKTRNTKLNKLLAAVLAFMLALSYAVVLGEEPMGDLTDMPAETLYEEPAPEEIIPEPEAVTLEPVVVSSDPVEVIPEPEVVTPEPATDTPAPATATPEPTPTPIPVVSYTVHFYLQGTYTQVAEPLTQLGLVGETVSMNQFSAAQAMLPGYEACLRLPVQDQLEPVIVLTEGVNDLKIYYVMPQVEVVVNEPALVEEAAPVDDAEPIIVEETPAEEAVEEAATQEETKEIPAEEAATDEQPTEEKPAEEQPTEEKPAEEAATEEKPAEEAATEEKPAEEAATEEKPAEEEPTEEKPAEVEPTEEKPAEEVPTEEKPAEEEPTEEKPAEEEPTEEKPTEEKPAEEEPTEEKPAEEEAAEEKPAEEQPAEEAATEETPEIITEDDLSDNALRINQILDELNANRTIDVYIDFDGEFINLGDPIRLVAVLNGYDNCQFTAQWQVSKDGENYVDVEGQNELVYGFVVDETNCTATWRLSVNITAVYVDVELLEAE